MNAKELAEKLRGDIDEQIKAYKDRRSASGGNFANTLGRNRMNAQEEFYYSDGVIDGLILAKWAAIRTLKENFTTEQGGKKA